MDTHNMMNKSIAKNQRWKLLTLALSMTIGASISSAEQEPTFVEESLEAYNERKAGHIYSVLDGSGFYTPHATPDSRSMMNLTFKTADADLDKKFLADAGEAGMSGLKGHRSVGGMRASIYNAVSEEAVDALIAFMAEFEKANG